ncbi:MAG TPA: P-type conjugative transfer ATPase TrbB [Caulobacteraceae bacterium]|nr:P-type conjugative transfer ATPase TrbB [Caulobacteraceae bacterium]
MRSLTADREREALLSDLGPVIGRALADRAVVEVMVNPDGKIWLDKVGEGRVFTGEYMKPADAESVLRLLANHAGEVVNRDHPRVSATLPLTGERFQGAFMPLVPAPAFAIRKRPEMIFRLDSYVEYGVMTAHQVDILREAVAERQNIVVAGGTGSGKTTLLNALLAEEAFANDRVIIIEDTAELQCSAADCVQLLTKTTEPPVTMADLVRDVLRMRPDRIIGGEVRDGATALNLLKAWNTGHPGGCTSIHANSAYEALTRLEDLIGEVTERVSHRSIAQAINLVVYIERVRGAGRRMRSIVKVAGHDGDYYRIEAVGG